MVKNLPAMQETQVRSLGQEDPLEEEMTTHCSILPWEIPWTEQSGWLQSMGSQRTGHDLVNKQQLKTKYEPAAQRSWGGGECFDHANALRILTYHAYHTVNRLLHGCIKRNATAANAINHYKN